MTRDSDHDSDPRTCDRNRAHHLEFCDICRRQATPTIASQVPAVATMLRPLAATTMFDSAGRHRWLVLSGFWCWRRLDGGDWMAATGNL